MHIGLIDLHKAETGKISIPTFNRNYAGMFSIVQNSF